MDKSRKIARRMNHYFKQYVASVPFSTHAYNFLDALRAQGRSLQSLHESALCYLKTQDMDQIDRSRYLKKIREKYNRKVKYLKSLKKSAKECQRFLSKYNGKRVVVWQGSRSIPYIGEIFYGSPTTVGIKRDRGNDYFSPDGVTKIEVIQQDSLLIEQDTEFGNHQKLSRFSR